MRERPRCTLTCLHKLSAEHAECRRPTGQTCPAVSGAGVQHRWLLTVCAAQDTTSTRSARSPATCQSAAVSCQARLLFSHVLCWRTAQMALWLC